MSELIDRMREARDGGTSDDTEPTLYDDEVVPFALNVKPFASVPYKQDTAPPTASGSRSKMLEAMGFGKEIPSGGTAASRGQGFSYVTTPPISEAQVARVTFNALVYGGQLNPYATDALMRDIELLPGAAEMAYGMYGSRALWRYNPDAGGLSEDNEFDNPLAVDTEIFQQGLEILSENPEWFGQFADAYWGDMVVALTSTYGSDAGAERQRTRVESHETMMRFKETFDSYFSSDEWELIYNVVAAVPDSTELLEAKGIDPNPDNILGKWWRNVQMAVKAPEAIRPYVNDPRTRLLNLAHSYFVNIDPNDPEQRVDFFNYIMSHANASISDVDRIQNSWFGALAAGTVDIVPTVALNALNDTTLAARTTLPWSGGPNEYGLREGLSAGENFALGLGFTPNDPVFHDVSGTGDAVLQIFGDPQNLIFGASAASKAARRYPMVASRLETLRAAANPFSRKAQGLLPLHAMSSTGSSRIFYAAFAKDADTLLDSARMTKHWNWLSNTTSKSKIAARYPTLPDRVVDALVVAKNPAEAKAVWRYALSGDEVLSVPFQSVLNSLSSRAALAADNYQQARRALIDAEGPEFNLSRLGVDDGVMPENVFVSDFYDEDTTALLENLSPTLRDEGAALVGVVDTEFGQMRAYRNDMATTLRNEDGEVVAAATAHSISVFDPAMRGKGLGKALLEQLTPENLESLGETASKSGSARAMGASRGVEARPEVFRRAALENDGTQKVAVSTLGRATNVVSVEDDNELARLASWLDRRGNSTLADDLIAGVRIRDLKDDELRLLQQYADARGVDVLSIGDEAVVGNGAELVRGVDGAADEAESLARTLKYEYYDMVTSRLDKNFANKKVSGESWIIHDLPHKNFSTGLWDFGRMAGSKLPDRWAQALRRKGFIIRHKLPENIDLISAANGAAELRAWSKALGMSDEWADTWVSRFTGANFVTRKKILDDWLLELGDELDLPWLKYELISRVNKGGVNTFEVDRMGRNIGGMADGQAIPMTLAHHASGYMMPNAKELLRAIKRYGQRSPARMHRGLLPGTKSRRADIVENLKGRMLRRGFDPSDLSSEDWARMAYSDVFASDLNSIRGAGAGWVNKVATAPVKIAQGFGSFFSISQLAGRPIAWNSRVLIEESFRDLLMGNTAMLRNPVEYFRTVWDAASISRLEHLDKVAAVETVRWVDEIWDAGRRTVDAKQFKRLFPDVPMFTDEGTGAAQWSKGDLAAFVSREFRGGRSFKPTFMGRRGNSIRGAYRNNRRIKAARSRLERYESIDDTFKWKVDGAEIANRSYVNEFVREVGTATAPIRWMPGSMSPHQVVQFGHSWGKAAKQMADDVVVGSYGLNRLAAKVAGTDTPYTAEKLAGSGSWNKLESIIDRYLEGNGMGTLAMSRVEKAQWYLDNVVDEISEALFRPLIAEMDEAAAADALQAFRRSGSSTFIFGGSPISVSVGDYRSAKTSFEKAAEVAAGIPDRAMPHTVAGYFEPMFGEGGAGGFAKWARTMVDREMMFFGETTTQALHRRKTFLVTKEQFFQRYKKMGWSDEVAGHASTRDAAAVTNWVFFDNSAIPQVLHDLNKIFPFFSAMFEVAQSWGYKIPMMEHYGFGLAHLVRRVDRTISGLFRSGMLDYNSDSGQMTFTAANDPDSNSLVVGAVSRGVFGMMKAPIHLMEWASGLTKVLQGEGFETDYSDWYKDGFRFSVGNPIDPTTFGLMAVNQFSVGFTPAYQNIASQLAHRAFAWDDQIIDVEPQTLADYLEANPDADAGQVLLYNKEAFIEKNGEAAFSDAKLGNIDLADLQMPDALRVPKTAWWESMVENTIFPFGQYREGWSGVADTIFAPIPSAVAYMIRGWGMTGQGETNDWLGYVTGAMSNYQAYAELAYQLQMIEAKDGRLTVERGMVEAAQQFRQDKRIEIMENGRLSGGTDEDRDAYQAMLRDIQEYNEETIRRATNNAAGGLFARGLLGSLGPVSPRSFAKEQDVVSQYWTGKDLAAEFAESNGSVNLANAITNANINGIEDMYRLAEVTQAWLADDSGDEAKLWLKSNMPGMEGFLQGRSFYGSVGLSPVTDTFEDWVDQIESGDITGVPIEVYAMRHHMASIANDRQFDIITTYGNDVDVATQRILSDKSAYYELLDEHNMKYDAVYFMDEMLYDGAYRSYVQRGGLDSFSLIEAFEQDARKMQDALDILEELLQYGNLDAQTEREVLADLRSTYGAFRDSYEDIKTIEASYRNPLEENLVRYTLEVAAPFNDARNSIWAQITETTDDTERSQLFRELRKLEDDALRQEWSLESSSGNRIAVPPPLVHSWNSKSEEDKATAIWAKLSKKPSWLNQFDVQVLSQQFDHVADYFPNSESIAHHDWLAEQVSIVREYARQNPGRMTVYERDQRIDDLEEQFRVRMERDGRGMELEYEDAVPFKRLALIGALPASLEPVAERFNLVLADLGAKDKSPTTQYGREQIIKFVDQWLDPVYFASNPQARADFAQLGASMYDEDNFDTLYGIILQGRLPLSRKLQ